MAKLTTEERSKLPSSSFVFPGSRSFPIHDWEHAKAAMLDSRGSKHAKVMAAVKRRFPSHFSGMRGNE